MKYKHIVFDIDGTLIDTEYAVLKSFQETIQEITGKMMPMEELKFCLGITGEDSLRILQFEDVPSAMSLWVEKLYEYKKDMHLFDGIMELLEALKKAGCKLGIVTSKERKQFDRDQVCLSIAHYFDFIVCSEDTEEHKPLPAPLLKYMELAGADKEEEVLYIGDSKYDKACAEGAGVDFALAVWGCGGNKIEANYYPEKPTDLLSLLEKE